MSSGSKMLLLALASTAMLSACQNVTPLSQGPRPYTAAHDNMEGDCRRISLEHKQNETVLPLPDRAVRCMNEQ